ncbi:MAG: cysteine-rich KTR domain-containing protein [Clostridia bacterium]|nr:cysteine-rich KTR domain-containing protein [Clostridia bacterium]
MINRIAKQQSSWIFCPRCGNKTRVKVLEKTKMTSFPLYCHWCKRETLINVANSKVVVSLEPDA